jgi:putative methionine-R-sulfoxide reductase with GAF domain
MKNFEELEGILEIFLKSLNIKNSIIRRRSGDKLILVSSIGYSTSEPKEISEIREGMSGLCAEKNIVITVNDLDNYHNKYFTSIEYIRSAVSIPLAINNIVIGTINFASEHKNNFDKKKIEVLESFVEIYKNTLLLNFAKNRSVAA